MQVHLITCYRDGVTRRFAPTALMLGNIITRCALPALPGMLGELSESLEPSGHLRCRRALRRLSLTAWLTRRIERRTLLAAPSAVTNVASAFAPDCTSLLVIRLVMLADRPALHATGDGDGNANRPSGKARRHERFCLSRMVAGGRWPAADHHHRPPPWLAFLLLALRLPGGSQGRRSNCGPGPISDATA